MFGWSSIKRLATGALAAGTAAAALALPASGASLDEDYAVSILNVYNAFNSEDELPNVKDRLKGRGAKPPVGQASARVLSVVHLEKNPAYTGPSTPQMDEVFCLTDQGMQEDLVSFSAPGSLGQLIGLTELRLL